MPQQQQSQIQQQKEQELQQQQTYPVRSPTSKARWSRDYAAEEGLPQDEEGLLKRIDEALASSAEDGKQIDYLLGVIEGVRSVIHG